MKIFIDLGHPAHVHYFKNFIWNMQARKHQIFVSARDKEVSKYLLEKYDINYFNRGTGSGKIYGKFLYLFEANLMLFSLAKKFKPDIFLSFASPYAAHVSYLLGKPNIEFDDTEIAHLNHKLYVPFTDVICTPLCFKKEFGKKHIRFNGYMELCYLHPKYFTPDNSVLNILGINIEEKFAVVRFVGWKATHDIGSRGIKTESKIKVVEELSKYAKVFISSELDLPSALESYKIQIPPDKMHDALYYASLFYGESSTMASECAVLGTPAIFIDKKGRGYTNEEELKYNLIHNFKVSNEDLDRSLERAIEILKSSEIKQKWKEKSNNMIADKIDVTQFMIWLIENYPDSIECIKRNQDYQRKFN